MKMTDLQAAIGCAQIKKLPSFIEARKRNWKMLRTGLAELTDKFILPEAAPDSDPSWFGFALTVRDAAGFSRDAIVEHLEENGIQTRTLFTGNILKHPCFDEMRKTGEGYRVAGELKNTDLVMKQTFWVGVYPGLDDIMKNFVVDKVKSFVFRH